MKRLNYLMNVMAAAAFVVLFAQCAGNAGNQATVNSAQAGGASGLKIAYVEMDTLLTKYNFCIDLNEQMVKKSENARLALNKEAEKLQKLQKDFQDKVQYQVYTKEKAEAEYNRLMKMDQELQAKSNNYQTELVAEQAKNNQILSDSINSFIKEYNKTKGYDLILSNTGFDNLLYANEALNITQEVLDGLNARYSTPAAK